MLVGILVGAVIAYWIVTLSRPSVNPEVLRQIMDRLENLSSEIRDHKKALDSFHNEYIQTRYDPDDPVNKHDRRQLEDQLDRIKRDTAKGFEELKESLSGIQYELEEMKKTVDTIEDGLPSPHSSGNDGWGG